MSSPVPKTVSAGKPKLLDRVRQLLRLRRYSGRTEQAYVAWIRRYILYHGKRHPSELDEEHVAAFLSSLALEGNVAASTQNQARKSFAHVPRQMMSYALCLCPALYQ